MRFKKAANATIDKVFSFLIYDLWFWFVLLQGKQEMSDGKPAAERTMLIFPGQGAQKVGMGAGLDKQFPEAKVL